MRKSISISFPLSLTFYYFERRLSEFIFRFPIKRLQLESNYIASRLCPFRTELYPIITLLKKKTDILLAELESFTASCRKANTLRVKRKTLSYTLFFYLSFRSSNPKCRLSSCSIRCFIHIDRKNELNFFIEYDVMKLSFLLFSLGYR